MSLILIAPDRMHDAARQFAQAGQQSHDMSVRLQQLTSAIELDWAGRTHEQFYQDYRRWAGQMQQFTNLLNGIGQQLDGIAARFTAVDNR